MNAITPIGAAAPRPAAGADDAAAQLARLLRRIHDPEIGLLRFLAEVPLAPDDAPVFLAVAECQNPFLLPPLSLALRGPAPAVTASGTGAALTRVAALWATVGEAIERHALYLYDPDAIVHAPIAALAGTGAVVVPPQDFILFDASQYQRPGFAYRRWQPETAIGWTPATRLTDGAPALLPAALAHMGYQHPAADERLDNGYSTGGAAGPGIEAAWLSGLFEVIERDGFALNWYLKRSPAELPLDAFRDQLSPALLAAMGRARLPLRFFDLTTDLGVPTVLAVGLPAGGGVAIGASARCSFAAAIEKAAVEAWHTHNWIIDLQRNGVTVDPAHGVREFRDHVIHHLDPAAAAEAAFLWAGGGERLPATVPDDAQGRADAGQRLRAVAGHLAAHGYSAFGIELTPEAIAGLGVAVGRAFVPGLHPLSSGTGNEHLDCRRLARFAAAAGLPLPDPARLNLAPHPFP